MYLKSITLLLSLSVAFVPVAQSQQRILQSQDISGQHIVPGGWKPTNGPLVSDSSGDDDTQPTLLVHYDLDAAKGGWTDFLGFPGEEDHDRAGATEDEPNGTLADYGVLGQMNFHHDFIVGGAKSQFVAGRNIFASNPRTEEEPDEGGFLLPGSDGTGTYHCFFGWTSPTNSIGTPDNGLWLLLTFDETVVATVEEVQFDVFHYQDVSNDSVLSLAYEYPVAHGPFEPFPNQLYYPDFDFIPAAGGLVSSPSPGWETRRLQLSEPFISNGSSNTFALRLGYRNGGSVAIGFDNIKVLGSIQTIGQGKPSLDGSGLITPNLSTSSLLPVDDTIVELKPRAKKTLVPMGTSISSHKLQVAPGWLKKTLSLE